MTTESVLSNSRATAALCAGTRALGTDQGDAAACYSRELAAANANDSSFPCTEGGESRAQHSPESELPGTGGFGDGGEGGMEGGGVPGSATLRRDLGGARDAGEPVSPA